MKHSKLLLSGALFLTACLSSCNEVVSENIEPASTKNAVRYMIPEDNEIFYDIKSWNFNYNDTKGWIDGCDRQSSFRPHINAYAIEDNYDQTFYKTLSSEESVIAKTA